MLQSFWDTWGLLITWAAGSVVIGIVLDTIIYTLLQRRAERLSHRVGQLIASALHGFLAVLALLVGVKIGSVRAALTPEQLGFVNQGLVAAAIVVLTAFGARVAGRLVDFYTSRDDVNLPPSTIFVNFARGIVWIIGGLTLLAAFDISIAPLLTALGVGGLAVGLALQDTLSNLFAGIQVLLSRQVQPGDFIMLETGQEGRVVDVTWRNTTIKMLSNDLVIVPNSKIGSELVTNFTSSDAQTVVWIPVGVAYDSDLEQVERVTREVAATIAAADYGADPHYDSLLRFDEFGDSAINLRVSLRANAYDDRWLLTTEMIKLLHKRYAEEGIAIPFPQRTIHMAAEATGSEGGA